MTEQTHTPDPAATAADAAAPSDAVEASQIDSGAPEPDAAVDDTPKNREEKFRKHSRALEAALATTNQRWIDKALADAGIDPRLFAAAGHSIESLTDDVGLLDTDKLADAVRTTAEEFKIPEPSRRPAPNPLAGQAGKPTVQSNSASIWENAFRGV